MGNGESTALRCEDVLKAYRLMLTARRLDDKEIQLKRQNKVFFQINGVGHECIQAAAAMDLTPGHDWFFFYYRDRALAIGLGMTAKDMFLGSVGAEAGPATGGRQMPSHWATPASTSSPPRRPPAPSSCRPWGPPRRALLRAEQGGAGASRHRARRGGAGHHRATARARRASSGRPSTTP